MDRGTQVANYVVWKTEQLLHTSNESAQKAALAELRHGLGRAPGELPELWGAFLQDLPEELYGTSAGASREEWAIYLALTLFALHQQGKNPNTSPMHQQGQVLGKAMGQLIQTPDDESRVRRRFNVLATSADIQEMSTHLRSVIQLLRGESIPLDYGMLAKDIFLYQFPEYAPNVRLAWGRDFYYRKPKESGKED